MSAIEVGFGSELAISLLGTWRIAIARGAARDAIQRHGQHRIEDDASDDGLTGSLGFAHVVAPPEHVAELPDADIGLALRVHVGGENHTVRVSSIKVNIASTGVSGSLGVRPETDADLQQRLPIE